MDDHISDEWYVVRHSGEIPEIALHSSLHYLTTDTDGPQLNLDEEQVLVLKRAAAERFREIVLRDLKHDNCLCSTYRGIGRSIINFTRYRSFCRRQQFNDDTFTAEVAGQLLLFLATEQVRVARGERASLVNCSFDDLNGFARELGLVESSLPGRLRTLCKGCG